MNDIVFDFTDSISAIDFCFKVFLTFNISYPPACPHIWSYFQIHIYSINDKASSTRLAGPNKIYELVNELERLKQIAIENSSTDV